MDKSNDGKLPPAVQSVVVGAIGFVGFLIQLAGIIVIGALVSGIGLSLFREP